MEMLVALVLFALIAALASQSVSAIAMALSKTREQRSEKIEHVIIQSALDRTMRWAGEGREIVFQESGPDDALFIQIEAGTSSLVWKNGAGNRDEWRLGQGQYQLRPTINARGLQSLVLVEIQGDDETIIASARSRITAPRNCLYDAIGRRCLEATQ
jgi:type II secretory pathway pseudopilin PulG